MPKKDSPIENVWSFFRAAGTVIKGIVSVGLTVLFIFIIWGSFSAATPRGNIAVIPVHGVIATETPGFGAAFADPEQIRGWLEGANASDDIKAVVIEINSPGGSPVASAQIAEAIKRVDKPVIAVITETGASGGYWVASAADVIFAHPMSITGSIGVTASSLAYPGLLGEFNLTYRRLVAGKYKDTGTPFREMTQEEKDMYQHILDSLYDEFVHTVALNRNMDDNRVRELATGFVYLGRQAKDLGLVDELGSTNDAIDYAGKLVGVTPEPARYKPQPGLMDALTGRVQGAFYSVGEGIGSSLGSDQVEIAFR